MDTHSLGGLIGAWNVPAQHASPPFRLGHGTFEEHALSAGDGAGDFELVDGLV